MIYEVTKKSEKVTTREARCGFLGGTPHICILHYYNWKYIIGKNEIKRVSRQKLALNPLLLLLSLNIFYSSAPIWAMFCTRTV